MARQLFYDPPDPPEFADRGDKAFEEWPGTIRTEEDIMAACGDPRDWFRYGLSRAARRWTTTAEESCTTGTM